MTEAARISPAIAAASAPVRGPRAGSGASRIWALVPCAGTGARAGTALPKQYRRIAGQALVLHTLAAFEAVARLSWTLVVVAADDDFFQGPGAPTGAGWSSSNCGGASRAGSVANGLGVLQAMGAADEDWVLVHDAARCLVTPELIDRLIDACLPDPVGGLLGHPVADTLKLAREGRVAATTDRAHHWLAQTPQMFRIGMLRAGLRAVGERVTDESGAMEALGLAPKLVPGDALNFKVTYPADFALAQAVLLGRTHTTRLDLRYDYP